MSESEDRHLTVVEHESFEAIELADEDLIVAEIEGRVTDKFIYELKGVRDDKGQLVIGLSYSGTNWACREYAKQGESIRVIGDKPEIMRDPIDPQYIIAVVRAQRFAIDPRTGNEVALDSTFGIKRQWCMMKKRKYDGAGNVVGEDIVQDLFYTEKAVSKAIRNAKQSLIPTDVVKRLIAKALEAKGGKPPAHPTPAKPAPQKPAPAQAAPPQPPPASAQPAPQAAPPQTTPPQTPAVAKPPAAKPGPKSSDKESLVQRFEVVLKKAAGTNDGAAARQCLKKLSGTDKITDFSEEDLRKYGRWLQQVVKGKLKLAEDKSRIVDAAGTVIWGQALPPTEEAQAQEPPAEGQSEDMF